MAINIVVGFDDNLIIEQCCNCGKAIYFSHNDNQRLVYIHVRSGENGCILVARPQRE